MAGNDVVLGIALDTKKAVSDLNSFHASASKVFGAIAAVAATAFASKALFSGIDSVIGAANEQVNAINKMNQSMVASGDYSKAASENMVAFAKALSGQIAVDDDAILSSLALAKSFGATNDQAKDLVKAAADLSAAMGTDLDTAVTQLGGTLSGSAGKLSKVAPQLKNMSEEALKSGAAIKILGERFAGSAEAATNTFSGAIEKTALSFDDLKTSLGLIITQNGALRKVIEFVSKAMEKLSGFVDDNKDALDKLLTEGILATVNGFALLIRAVGSFSPLLDILKTGVVSLGKGFATLAFAGRALGNVFGMFDDIGTQEEIVNKNLETLLASFEKLESVQNIDLSGIADSLTGQASDFAEELKRNIEEIKIDKPIDVNIVPHIKPGTTIDFNDPNARGPQPTIVPFSLPDQNLPGAGPDSPTDAQVKAGQDMLEAANKQQENNAAMASSVVGAFSKGGYEGAQQIVASAATAIAAALGAGPFAQVVGEIVTFLTTDGVVQLVKSVADNIDEVIFALAENMPLVAVALVKSIVSVKFVADIAKALVNGFSSGIKQAFKEAGPQLASNFIEPMKTAVPEFVGALVGGLSEGLTVVYQELKFALSNSFTFLAEGAKKILTGIQDAFTVLITRTPQEFIRILTAYVEKLSGAVNAVFIQAASILSDAFIAAMSEFTSFATDFKNQFTTYTTNLTDGLTNFFDGISHIFDPLIDFVNQLTGGSRSFGTKVSDAVKNPAGAFSLTGDSGTIQSQSSGMALTGAGSADVSTALLAKILAALEKPMNVTSKVTLDSRTLADIMLELSRRNARTA